MLELQNISKRFGNHTAVQPTDLSLEASKVYVLLGRSGCGKSTMLKLILGLLTPDTGSVRLNGTELSDKNSEQIRQRLGYVIQRGGLFPHLSAEQNVTIVARHLGWKQADLEKRVSELRQLTQLPPESLARFPSQLSGGQQQRVGLMRALMLDPDILLFDEPLGALDPVIRNDLQEDLRTIFRELNKTVVLVTHDLNEAAWFADEVILMDAGAIVQHGTIDEFMHKPATPFVTQFITAQRSHLPGPVS